MSLERAELEAMFERMGEPSFRARQVLQWLYQRQTTCMHAMTDLSKPLRQRLQQEAVIALPEIVRQQLSADGSVKWLLKLSDGNCIESVFIPEATRGTLCVSSQVGCSLNCSFCATARQGFNRNLTVDEIIGQVWRANQAWSARQPALPPAEAAERHAESAGGAAARRPITNIVMMGMGEPLLNFQSVVSAMRLMMDDFAFGLSRRRVTLSTAGLVPAIDRLAAACPVSLAVSLHAPSDALRDQLVPLNKKYPIAQLLAACRRYVGKHNRQVVTFEYVMLKDVNDSAAQARALARLLGDMPAKVNLIPFNSYAGIQYQRSTRPVMERFRDILLSKNIVTVTRKTRGDDIDAACGQLAGKVIDRTRRSSRLLQQQSATQPPATNSVSVSVSVAAARTEFALPASPRGVLA